MIFNNKRGQSLSLNTIIIAALALIVLVVLIFIFSGKIKLFGQGTTSCSTQGGQCSPVGTGYTADCIKSGSCQCPDTIPNAVFIQGTDCEAQSRICCKSIF